MSAGVNDEGEIQYLNTRVYIDAGSTFNDPIIQYVFSGYTNVYDSSTWSTKMYDVRTDKPSNVWARGPGNLEGVAIPEIIMNHIAHEVDKDPLSVRMINFNKEYPIQGLVDMLKQKSDLESRKQAVEQFNKKNVWKKRGISLVPMRFFIATIGAYHATISVYSKDGSVAISHGGIEIGQGINTKAAQVCASALRIPLNTVVVKQTDIFVSPNNLASAASIVTESVCLAVERCCEELNRRLEPIRAAGEYRTFADLIQAAYLADIDLKVSYLFAPNQGDLKQYNVYGASVLEVEVDILTGEHKIIRVDILEDAGKSLNPFVDIGQIEGAYIMGLGYWTSEELIKDPNTGRTLTNRTLKYEIPGAKDIPVDLRVYILKNGDNPLGILRSKAVGEPPICTTCSIMFAIKQALRSAREDFRLPNEWLAIDAPFTAEKIFLSSGIDKNKYLLQ
ncbi:hypothetical protein J6590_069746 [Homalodisca vitripennis]|nr:hypothetical protein J6590_069746 [Homalodisca vitripennis]